MTDISNNDSIKCWGCIKSTNGALIANISSDYFSVGTGTENDINITNSAKSHFAISKDPTGKAWICDLSGISTFVNGSSIKDNACELKTNDLILVTGDESNHTTGRPTWSARFHIIGDEKAEKRECSPDRSTETKRLCLRKEASMHLDTLLVCNICFEVMYECHSIQPCLHSFCKVCILEWRIRDNICPTCRTEIKGIGKNYQLSSIIDHYIVHHPDAEKTTEEKEAINTKTSDLEKHVFPISFTTDINQPIVNNQSHVPLCEWCNISVSVIGQICNSHTKCTCCRLKMPTSTAAIAANLLEPNCRFCHKAFCGFIRLSPDACRCPIYKCTGSLEDFRQESIWLPPPLLSNTVESNFVKAFLQLKGIGDDAFLDNLFTRLNRISTHLIDDGLDRTALGSLTPGTRMCFSCRRLCLSRLLLDWRASLTEDDKKQAWPERADCYYGVNCRTQRNSLDHAQRFNHCCPQTRFH